MKACSKKSEDYDILLLKSINLRERIMKLLYLWIKNYKGFEKEGFNFSSNYNFNFIDGKISIKKNKSLRGFYGEQVKEITGILGANGSGKSRLFQIISTLNNNQSKELYFFIYENNEELYLVDPNNLVLIEKNRWKVKDKKDFKVKIIHYSDDLESLNFYNSTNYYNVNTSFLIKKFEGINKFPVEEYLFKEWKSQINFIKSKKDVITKLPYEDYVEKIKSIDRIFLGINESVRHSKDEKIIKKENFYLDKIGDLNNTGIDKEFWKRTINSCWQKLITLYVADIESNLLNDLEVKEREKGEDIFLWLKRFVSNLVEQSQIYHEKMKPQGRFYSSPKVDSFIRFIDNFISKENVESDSLTLGESKIGYEIISPSTIAIATDMFSDLENFNSFSGGVFLYRWPVSFSKGERALLKFMARINDLNSSIDMNGNYDDVLILIDELDSDFHPEWKRKIIEFLTIFFEYIFIKMKFKGTKFEHPTNKNSQIILTSHSPFTASDLLKDNLVLLEEMKVVKNEINTFGANIFELYKTAFFLKSMFGEFSKNKIRAIAKLLTPIEGNYNLEEVDKKNEEIRYTINLLGESLIRVKLENMYEHYLSYKAKKELSRLDERRRKVKVIIEKSGLSEEEFKDYFSGDE